MAKPTKMKPFDVIFAFVCPMVLGKSLILYFGSNYSSNPGEGYGTGLVLSICFTLTMMGRFMWKYWDLEDPSDRKK